LHGAAEIGYFSHISTKWRKMFRANVFDPRGKD
jgi:hypothetical protein